MAVIKIKRTTDAYAAGTHKLYPGELTVIQGNMYFGRYITPT